jgi:murein tripeptide amidase MpaA
MGAIMSTAEIESALVFFETTYPALCHRVELPNKTIEQRTCHALHMGLPNAPGHPAGLVIGGVHAREWAGPDIVVSFANDILSAYANGKGLQYGGTSFSSADIKQIFEHMTIVVFPCVNPDGVEFSHNSVALWRKNRNPASSGGDPSKIGVDINRNYDFLWDFKTYFNSAAWSDIRLASDNPSVDTFHGTAPFSEPETRNVSWLMDTYANLTLFLDLHSYTGDVLYNWGDDENQNTNPAMNFANPVYNGQRGVIGSGYREYLSSADQLATSMIAATIRDAMNGVRGRAYVAKPEAYLYPTAGASDDYAFSRYVVQPGKSKIFGYTIEFNFVGDGALANPPTDPFLATADPAIYDLTLRDVIPGLIAFCLQVPPPVWQHLSPIPGHALQADFDCSGLPEAGRTVRLGDVDGDGRAEVVVQIDAAHSGANDFWVMKFDQGSGSWRHLSPIPGHPLQADFDCSGLPNGGRSVSAGDVDGDERAEVIVQIDASGSGGNDFWVMRWPAFPAEVALLEKPVSQTRARIVEER